MVFIEDILVYSKDREDHDTHLRVVLETLRERNSYMPNGANANFD